MIVHDSCLKFSKKTRNFSSANRALAHPTVGGPPSQRYGKRGNGERAGGFIAKLVDADAADREDSLGTTNEREYARFFLMMKCSRLWGTSFLAA